MHYVHISSLVSRIFFFKWQDEICKPYDGKNDDWKLCMSFSMVLTSICGDRGIYFNVLCD
jgi:hypothetical protein